MITIFRIFFVTYSPVFVAPCKVLLNKMKSAHLLVGVTVHKSTMNGTSAYREDIASVFKCPFVDLCLGNCDGIENQLGALDKLDKNCLYETRGQGSSVFRLKIVSICPHVGCNFSSCWNCNLLGTRFFLFRPIDAQTAVETTHFSFLCRSINVMCYFYTSQLMENPNSQVMQHVTVTSSTTSRLKNIIFSIFLKL